MSSEPQKNVCKVSQTKNVVKEAVRLNEAADIKSGSLPVTVLSGFLGAGKTTLLQHILKTTDKRIACIVNDVAALNIDSLLVKTQASGNVKQQSEELIELQNGCVCCTLRADLVVAVADMARQGNFDAVVIECTGMAEPLQVAATFLMSLAINEKKQPIDKDGNVRPDPDEPSGEANPLQIDLPSLHGLARLDTLVTVVDCASFFDLMEQSGNALAEDDGTGNVKLEKNEEFCPLDSKTVEDGKEDGSSSVQPPVLIVDLMTQQVEFADVIVINKTDLATKETLERVQKAVCALNTGAKIITTVQSKVDPEEVLDTKLFDAVQTSDGVGWLRALRETKDFGVDSFVYRRRRPFHPQRFGALMSKNFLFDTDWESRTQVHHDHDHSDPDHVHPPEEDLDKELVEKTLRDATLRKQAGQFKSVLRSKGYVWIATRPDIKGVWGQAGSVMRLDPEGPWRAVLGSASDGEGEDDDLTEEEEKNLQLELKEHKHGDRKQEVVIIGILNAEDRKEIERLLDECLVSDEEWADLPSLVQQDPIPMWQQSPFDDWNKHIEGDPDAWYLSRKPTTAFAKK